MGGKKKKTALQPLKKESKYKIPARFDCPVCDSKAAIAVKISRPKGLARIFCTQCLIGSEASVTIKPLEKSVDVFFKFRETLAGLDQEDNPVTVTAPSVAVEGSIAALTAPEVPDAIHYFEPQFDDELELSGDE